MNRSEHTAAADVANEEIDAARAEADAGAEDVEGFAPADERERVVLRYLRIRAKVAAEIVRVADQWEAFIREQESRIKSLDYVYLGAAEEYARDKLRGRKQKSVKTPFATIGFRTHPAKFTIENMELAVKSAERVVPDAVRYHAPSVDKKACDDYMESTGELLPGFGREPAAEKFYVK